MSVIPVRPGADATLEVFVQHRAKTMDFSADVVAFPGGRVSAEDHVPLAEDHRPIAEDRHPSPFLDRHVRAWSRTRIASAGVDSVREMCRVLLRCCQREIHEETGWRLAPADLVPWANWVTPPDLPKRFDTYFFIATAPEGAVLKHTTTEAERSEWRSVPSLLADYQAGTVRLMRPTLALLEELGQLAEQDFRTARTEAIAAHRPRRARPY